MLKFELIVEYLATISPEIENDTIVSPANLIFRKICTSVDLGRNATGRRYRSK